MYRSVNLSLGLLVLMAAVVSGAPQAKPPPVRYGIEADLDNYPQADPKSALASVLKAIDNKKIDYLLAQLSDPQWVDDRVKTGHGGKLEGLVKETTGLLANDPTAVAELRRFLREGNWGGDDTEARVTLKDLPDKQVILRNIGGYWYLKNDRKEKGK
jgi:hypothetical protein